MYLFLGYVIETYRDWPGTDWTAIIRRSIGAPPLDRVQGKGAEEVLSKAKEQVEDFVFGRR